MIVFDLLLHLRREDLDPVLVFVHCFLGSVQNFASDIELLLLVLLGGDTLSQSGLQTFRPRFVELKLLIVSLGIGDCLLQSACCFAD